MTYPSLFNPYSHLQHFRVSEPGAGKALRTIAGDIGEGVPASNWGRWNCFPTRKYLVDDLYKCWFRCHQYFNLQPFSISRWSGEWNSACSRKSGLGLIRIANNLRVLHAWMPCMCIISAPDCCHICIHIYIYISMNLSFFHFSTWHLSWNRGTWMCAMDDESAEDELIDLLTCHRSVPWLQVFSE